MSNTLVEYAIVEVVKLARNPKEYNGWGVNKRPPAVGERGTIVDIHEENGQTVYVVESESVNGVPAWLGVFTSDEIISSRSERLH